jgi:hypothetical protein
VNTTSLLLLIIGIESALIVGFVAGLWVMDNVAAHRRAVEEAQRKLGVSEGRLAYSELNLATAQGRLEGAQRLGSPATSRLADVSEPKRCSAS